MTGTKQEGGEEEEAPKPELQFESGRLEFETETAHTTQEIIQTITIQVAEKIEKEATLTHLF